MISLPCQYSGVVNHTGCTRKQNYFYGVMSFPSEELSWGARSPELLLRVWSQMTIPESEKKKKKEIQLYK